MTKEANSAPAKCSICHMDWPFHRGNCSLLNFDVVLDPSSYNNIEATTPKEENIEYVYYGNILKAKSMEELVQKMKDLELTEEVQRQRPTFCGRAS